MEFLCWLKRAVQMVSVLVNAYAEFQANNEPSTTLSVASLESIAIDTVKCVSIHNTLFMYTQ
jgi:hypothetical protein